MLALSAIYLTLAPVMAVETARSYQVSQNDHRTHFTNVSVIYKTDTQYVPMNVTADRG